MKRRASSLTKKWIVNVLLTVFVFLVIINVAVDRFSWNYYYDSIYQSISTRLSIIAENFGSYVESDEDIFDTAAVEFAEGYGEKEYYEVQIFSDSAKLIVSTSGFLPSETVFEDYNEAISSETRTAVFKGKQSSGEQVMSKTVALGVNSKRAVRMVVSMEGAREQAKNIMSVVFFVSLILFITVFFTGYFFIRGIVRPLNSISRAAKEISQGNFDIKIPTGGNGEIGELCSAINDMAEELGSTEKMKNNFISSVSHELRTPLTAIKGWSETVKEAADEKELVEKGMSVISAESERLNTLVEDLLDFSRLQNGSLSYDMKSCDINVPLGEVVTAFAETAGRKGIEIIFSPKSLKNVYADASRLKQVFVNIIDNSIKNTDSGGKIKVFSRKGEFTADVIIEDSGKGIPADEIDKVKIKFFKTESNKTVPGSGIGLAVADEIVRAHNGELIISSELGIGTSVQISIPYERNKYE